MVNDSQLRVEVGDRLTAGTAADVRARVTAVVQPGATISLDLRSVSSFDAAGLGLLLGLNRLLRAMDGQLVCVNPAPQLAFAMRRFGLHHVLVVVLDLSDSPRAGRLVPDLPQQGRRGPVEQQRES